MEIAACVVAVIGLAAALLLAFGRWVVKIERRISKFGVGLEKLATEAETIEGGLLDLSVNHIEHVRAKVEEIVERLAGIEVGLENHGRRLSKLENGED